MRSPTVLYDGWPLIYEPSSPAAVHLWALLDQIPEQVEAIVALPGPPPAWLNRQRTLQQDTPASDAGHLLWEQRLLPRIALRAGAQILHLTSLGAPLLGKAIRVTSPGNFEGENWFFGRRSSQARPRRMEKRSLAARLRSSLAQGGLARARAIFWPEDSPFPNLPLPLVKLPPVVHPSFAPDPVGNLQVERAQPAPNGHPHFGSERIPDTGPERLGQLLASIDLPESYVLYHGPTGPYWLQRLLESWQWASGPIGGSYPLVILGMPENRIAALSELVSHFDLGETVVLLPAVPVEALPAVYRGCSAYFHPAPLSPWGSPVRNALACGKPVVAAESQLANGIVGPAAYLAPTEDSRALGGALLTVIVEEELAGELAHHARQRSNTWRGPAFGRALEEAYRNLLNQDNS